MSDPMNGHDHDAPEERNAPGRAVRMLADRWRRVVPVAAGLVAVAVAVAGWVLWPSSGSDDAEPAGKLPVTADPVPSGPIARGLPENCGVSEATLKAVVPEREMRENGDFGYCEWSQRISAESRYLTVELTQLREDGMKQSDATTYGTLAADWIDDAERLQFGVMRGPRVKVAPLAAAVEMTTPTTRTDEEVLAVKGLGEDAVAAHDPSAGALVAFRVGNTVGSISYRGTGPRPAPQKELMDVALRIASDSARALGMPPRVKPEAVKQEKTPDGGKKPSGACSLVPAAAMEHALGGKPSSKELAFATNRVEPPDLEPPDVGSRQVMQQTGCRWKANGHTMRVVLRAIPDTGQDTGVRLATRGYLMMHLNARAEEPLSRKGKKYFTALKGLGQQAFGSYVEGSTPARVLFRRGGVLAEVSYGHPDGSEPSDGKSAVGLAYDIAAQVQKGMGTP
ncbi:hypothetical protein E1293_36020 [Actinomadura darangshiensis]|uniref:DUF3558 domain-containing protein n=1 Tax=Actinomadura darangshiensis TaxID=705336 RepID=A0A4R5AAR5_9ACTN|nr:hypothetical protein [Actinomadura darangshiensis]TDD69221.1 hypothetical protein E1293_36020 [Actinomadura darangshiensis]